MSAQDPPERPGENAPIYDVLIAGAGPVGLFLAHELALSKVSVLVLEEIEDMHSPLKRLPLGMRGLIVPTIEAFYRRGLLDDLTKDPPVMRIGAGGPQQRRPAGHFAGIPFDRRNVDTSKWTYYLPSPAETMIMTDMERIETVLAERAHAIGARIRYGLGIQSFTQSDDEVTVRAGEETFRTRWLVGCDGGRSTVRKLGGFELVGTDPEFTGYSALAELADPHKLRAGRHFTPAGMYQTQPGSVVMADFDGGKFHRSGPVTLEQLQAVLRRVSNTDVTISAVHIASSWTDRAQQATAYRRGRVFLAGDAAHLHSPVGGQGLNLGLGDALNLGWKLAATVHGWAPDGLLDTYFTERHPIGMQVLDWSRAQVALMKPSQGSSALQAIMSDIIATGDGATYFAKRAWGISVRYDPGREDSHPLVGRSAPDFELDDGGTKLGVLLQGGKGLLLDFNTRAALRAVWTRWEDRIEYVTGGAKEQVALSVVLIRPDGFVAWACDGDPDIDALRKVLLFWFGAES